MKLCNIENESFTNGVKSTTAFRVAATPTMMKFLSDILYSDKILAPMRELATNAVDSHKAANCLDKPFDIQLPTRDSLIFRIRDYGTGLSQRDMEKLYTTYGASNKNQSNDFNGCLGLGSKSPFAYCDTFTSISYHKGRKLVYVAAKDMRGMPTLNLVLDEETDEPDGLEVSFPVKDSDRHRFVDKAKSLYVHMPTKPNFVGYPNFKLTEDRDLGNILYSGKNWKLYSSKFDSTCTMGYIEYPIDPRQFANDAPTYGRGRLHSQQTIYYNMLSSGLLINFDIGEVDMSGSREGLQYNDYTKNRIKEIVDEVVAVIKDDIATKFDSCNTYWEAREKLAAIKNSAISKIVHYLNFIKLEWRDRSLNETLDISGDVICLQKHAYKTSGVHVSKNPSVIKVVDNGTFLVIDDMKSGGQAALKREMAKDKYKHGCIFYLIREPENSDKFNELIETVGIDKSKLLRTSNCPKIVNTSRASTTNGVDNSQIRIMQFESDGRNGNIYSQLYNSKFWKTTNVDFDTGGFYIVTNRYEPYHNNVCRGIDALRDVIVAATRLGIFDKTPTVHGIKTKDENKYAKHPKWINLIDYIKAEINKLIDLNSLHFVSAVVNTLDILKSTDEFTYKLLCYSVEKGKSKTFGRVRNNFSHFYRIKKEHSNLHHIKNILRVWFLTSDENINLNKNLEDVIEEARELCSRYPMLELLNNTYSHLDNETFDKCIEYAETLNLIGDKT